MSDEERFSEEVEDFLNDFSTTEGGEVGDEQGEPPVEVTETETAEAQPTEETVTEEPTEQEAPEEEPVEEDELTSLQKRNEELISRINELMGAPTSQPQFEEEVEEPATPEAQPAQPVDESDFFGDLDFDDVIENKGRMNVVLSTVYNRAVNTAVEEVLRAIPQLTVGYINRYLAVKELTDRFYETNPDLSGVKNVVQANLREFIQQTPEADPITALGEAGKRARKMLGLKELAMQLQQGGNDRPAFAGTGRSGPRGGTGLGALEREINELIKDQ